MNEFLKTEKIIIEYPAYTREICVIVGKNDIETTKYSEVVNGNIHYFKKESDNIFRVYKIIKSGITIYPNDNEE